MVEAPNNWMHLFVDSVEDVIWLSVGGAIWLAVFPRSDETFARNEPDHKSHAKDIPASASVLSRIMS